MLEGGLTSVPVYAWYYLERPIETWPWYLLNAVLTAARDIMENLWYYQNVFPEEGDDAFVKKMVTTYKTQGFTTLKTKIECCTVVMT